MLIMRGIGYRVFLVKNSFNKNKRYKNSFLYTLRPLCNDSNNESEFSYMFGYDFCYSRYLLIRAGHTKDSYRPLIPVNSALTSKKDRKLVVINNNKIVLADIAKQL